MAPNTVMHPITGQKLTVRKPKDLAKTMWGWEKKELSHLFKPPNGPTPAFIPCAPCARAQQICMLDPGIEHPDRGYKCVTCPNVATCGMLENIPKYEKWFETYSQEFAQLVRQTEVLKKKMEKLQEKMSMLEEEPIERGGSEDGHDSGR